GRSRHAFPRGCQLQGRRADGPVRPVAARRHALAPRNRGQTEGDAPAPQGPGQAMSTPFLESELCTAYEEEAGYYAQALAVAELLSPTLSDGHSGHDLLNQIGGLIAQINGVEERIAEAKK